MRHRRRSKFAVHASAPYRTPIDDAPHFCRPNVDCGGREKDCLCPSRRPYCRSFRNSIPAGRNSPHGNCRSHCEGRRAERWSCHKGGRMLPSWRQPGRIYRVSGSVKKPGNNSVERQAHHCNLPRERNSISSKLKAALPAWSALIAARQCAHSIRHHLPRRVQRAECRQKTLQ